MFRYVPGTRSAEIRHSFSLFFKQRENSQLRQIRNTCFQVT